MQGFGIDLPSWWFSRCHAICTSDATFASDGDVFHMWIRTFWGPRGSGLWACSGNWSGGRCRDISSKWIPATPWTLFLKFTVSLFFNLGQLFGMNVTFWINRVTSVDYELFHFTSCPIIVAWISSLKVVKLLFIVRKWRETFVDFKKILTIALWNSPVSPSTQILQYRTWANKERAYYYKILILVLRLSHKNT